MKVSNISFPHPVLGKEDDVTGFYKPEYVPVLDRDKIVLSVKYVLSNPTLEKLVSQKKAFFAVQLNCPQTIYRRTWYSYDKTQNIEIESSELRNGVEVSFYIIAERNIPNYVIDGANQDYKGYEFYIDKGDILAYDGIYKFLAEKTWASTSSLDSIFDVQRLQINEGPMEFIATEKKIIIKLAKKDYDKYVKAYPAKEYYPIIHSSIAFPALIYALNETLGVDSDNEEERGNCLWEEVLESRINSDEVLKRISRDKTKIPEIAQILLRNPVSRTLDALHGIIYDD